MISILSLQSLLKSGKLKPGSIQRVAIVGPGLDFVNKQQGVDYYPPQTTQPFAVLDSLLRLGLSNPQTVEVYTLDISPRVNVHIEAARKNAAAGREYTVQLAVVHGGTLDRRLPRQVYELLAESRGADRTASCCDPSAARISGLCYKSRQDSRRGVSAAIKPVDMNIVYQRLPARA